jgi:Trypsin-like peptidase domain
MVSINRTGLTGIELGRVAEVLVTVESGGLARRGSGYLVSPGVVLTACHVVQDALKVRLRFNADQSTEWMVTDTEVHEFPAADVAVICYRDDLPDNVWSCSFARIGEQDAVIICTTAGFPLWKMRSDQHQVINGSPGTRQPENHGKDNASFFRDVCHVRGTAPVLANRREGTLEINVAPPEASVDSNTSPWEGMSGAAVFSGGHIVGVVARHYRSDGPGRITASRIDRWYECLPIEQMHKLAALLGLPAQVDALVDVVPVPHRFEVGAAFIAQAYELAPEDLKDRNEELAELIAFCAGDETGQNDTYFWWQAAPYAGKTAIAATFACYPPSGVKVVSFFVTRRLAGHADSNAFIDAITAQLAELVDRELTATLPTTARYGHALALLDEAARRLSERGQRLILLVDGLDEDQSLALGLPSIASLLPRRSSYRAGLPPTEVPVIVTSRPHPGMPGDVAADHPLRSCQPRELCPSAYAQNLRIAAKKELMDRLRSGIQEREIIALIAASGGGLTARDLGELTRRPKWEVQDQLESEFGRTLQILRSGDQGAGHAYIFAHEMLRQIAEYILKDEMHNSWASLHEWAARYREMHWPNETPNYLFAAYAARLNDIGEVSLSATLGIDTLRHERMLLVTGSDAMALAEIARAQKLELGEDDSALAFLAALAAERYRLATRNVAIPVGLPAVWARVGHTDHAENLAWLITDSARREDALARVSHALNARRDWKNASRVAQALRSTEMRVAALAKSVEALAIAGLRDDAASLARELEIASRTIANTENRAAVLADVSRALAVAAYWDDAVRVARIIPGASRQADVLALIAKRLATAERSDDALRVARIAGRMVPAIGRASQQAVTLARVAEALAATGHRDEAMRMAHDAEHVSDRISNVRERTSALVEVAGALAAVQLWRDAERVARAVPSLEGQVEALGKLAGTLTAAGNPNDASRFIHEAERVARAVPSLEGQVEALSKLAGTLTAAGNPNDASRVIHEAERIARAVTDVKFRARALTAVTEKWTAIGRLTDALGLAHEAERGAGVIPVHVERAEAFTQLAEVLAYVSSDDAIRVGRKAEHAARTTIDTWSYLDALTTVVRALAGAGQSNEVERLVSEIQRIARALPSEEFEVDQLQGVINLAETLANSGHREDALRLCDTVEQLGRAGLEAHERDYGLSEVVRVLAAAEHYNDAEQLTYVITDSSLKASALAYVAGALASAGRHADATRIACQAECASDAIEEDDVAGRSDVAHALAVAHCWKLAEQTARAISSPGERIAVLADIAEESVVNGRLEDAVRLAREIEHDARAMIGRWRMMAEFNTFARVLAAAGNWEFARQTILTLPRADYRVNALAELACGLANAGSYDDAVNLAVEAEREVHTIADAESRIEALTKIARTLAASGQWELAQQTAIAIPIPLDQVAVIMELVVELAAAGRHDAAASAVLHAERLVRSIADSAAETGLLVRLARTLANTILSDEHTLPQGPLTVQLKRILGLCLRDETWLEVLSVLGRISPHAVVAVSERLVGDRVSS